MASEPLHLQIITPEGKLFTGDALAVTLPGELGEMQVFVGHVPLLTRLVPGLVRVHQFDGSVQDFTIEDGFARITLTDICILAESVNA